MEKLRLGLIGLGGQGVADPRLSHLATVPCNLILI